MAISINQIKHVVKPFFNEPSKSKYIREIERESDASYERVCYYLNELEKIGALFSERRKKIKEYRLNKDHDLIHKAFSILEMEHRQNFFEKNKKSRVSLLKLKENLLNNVGDSIKFIILFGSTARGHAKEKSDIDILVVIISDSKKVKEKIKCIEQDLNIVSPLHFSIQVVTLKEFRTLWKKEPVYATIWQDRIVLFNEESFWREVLKMGEPI